MKTSPDIVKEDLITLPYLAQDVWDVFLQLHRTRSVSMTPNPISFTEIHSWCNLHARSLCSRTIKVIRTLDQTFLSLVAENKSKKESSDDR